MRIRKATTCDINRVMEIYAIAKQYMNKSGNPTQWQDGYPSQQVVERDISLEQLYLLLDDNEHIVAQFCYFIGDDPTYQQIKGEWLNTDSYGVVHRLASSGEVKGTAQIILDWCFTQHPNIRIDTHADNLTLQHILQKNGYIECGEITVLNGTKRMAFQRF